MKIKKAVENIGTAQELKRIARAHVIDYRNLSEQEMRAAIIKTAPQYYHAGNVESAVQRLFLHAERRYRILSRLILREVLLQKDDFTLPAKKTEEELIDFEQSIIDRSNEDLQQKGGERTQALKLFEFILDVAWKHKDAISQDEKNLIEKLKTRLKITDTEYHIIEAKLRKFPKAANIVHTRGEIEDVRRAMQKAGLLFAVRDEDGTHYDVIPDEVAESLRKVLGIEIRRYGYRELLNHRLVKSKKYYQEILGKCGIAFDKGATIQNLQDGFVQQVNPSTLLGGVSPRDGLDIADLRSWCSDLGIRVSGHKPDVIARIINHYDALLERKDTKGDEREVWYQCYVELASRKLDFLRSQQIIQKDLECESKFEAATSFLFDKKLGHTPLKMLGTSRPDGAISYQDKLIYWDNKSKESPVNLKDHLKQFDGYIRAAERPVAGFLVIGPSFTPESSRLAMQHQVESGTTITMIKAEDLKAIGEAWDKQNEKGKQDPFPLGYLIQPGFFNKDLVAALLH